jgi:hypothetical protein
LGFVEGDDGERVARLEPEAHLRVNERFVAPQNDDDDRAVLFAVLRERGLETPAFNFGA